MVSLTEHLTAWARQRPQAPAVEFQRSVMTYAELDRASSAVAAALAAGGVSPGDRVGLWLRKSLESIVSVYGVLKAGAAYVPIDPSAPQARAARIIADCDLTCIIANDDHVDLLMGLADETGAQWPVIAVGAQGADTAAGGRVTGWQAALDHAATALPAIGPDATAYILYTSGSEGIPKGVTISHANALAFVEWSVREFGMTTDDRVSSHAPLHFDLSILDLFATGLAGGCIVLIPEGQAGMGGVLNRLVAQREVTVWYSVPNALTRMLTADGSELLASSALRVVLFAGETFPVGSLRRLRHLLPGVELYNLYGPTETNVCTYHRVRDTDVAPDRTEPAPIGRPCPYADAFIVDGQGRELAPEPGVTGELCVSGQSVMLGYWGDAAATGGRMLTLQRAAGEPVQVYRTGDIVRLDSELNYVFCGRDDDMVKIRGHRVELGEVESALAEAANVAEAVCVVVGDDAEGRRIEAFVVPLSLPCDEDEVRRHCLTALPRYMVPDRFRIVAELPRTQSGKLDRRALLGV